jgi:hypothetical protein
MKTLVYLLICLLSFVGITEVARVIWLPEAILNTPTLFQGIVLFIADGPLLMLLALLIFKLNADPKFQHDFGATLGRLFWPAGAGLWLGLWGLSLLSVAWSREGVLALFSSFHLMAGLFLALVIVQQGAGIYRPLLWALLLGAVLQAAIGLGQALHQDMLGLHFLGEPRYPFRTEAGRLRAYGLNSNPNQLAAYLGLGLFALLGLWEGQKKAALFYALGLLLGLGLIATGSRAALIACGLGLASLWLGPWRALALSPLFLLGALLLRALLWPDMQAEAWAGRLFFEYEDTWQVIQSQPLQGVGMQQLLFHIADLHPPQTRVLPAHNSFLIVWAELGAVGLGLYLGAYLVPLWHGRGAWRAAWLMLGVILAFDFYLWSDWHMRSLFFLALGLLWLKLPPPNTPAPSPRDSAGPPPAPHD